MRLLRRVPALLAAGFVAVALTACGSSSASIVGASGASSAAAATPSTTSDMSVTASPSSTRTNGEDASQAAEPAAPAGGAHIGGMVAVSASCAIASPPMPCPMQPLATRVDAHAASGGATRGDGPIVASTQSGGDGRFTVDVPAGDYVLSAAADDASVTCSSVPVHVDESAVANITCAPAAR